MLTATIHEVLNDKQTVYKLSRPIRIGSGECRGPFRIWNKIKDSKFKTPWKPLISKNGIEYVVMSDAHTHLERLIFPAFFLENGETGEKKIGFDHHHIAGHWTMMIHGGDPSSMHPIEHYLEELDKLNKEVN